MSLFTGVSFTVEYICHLDIKGILGLTDDMLGSEADSSDTKGISRGAGEKECLPCRFGKNCANHSRTKKSLFFIGLTASLVRLLEFPVKAGSG